MLFQHSHTIIIIINIIVISVYTIAKPSIANIKLFSNTVHIHTISYYALSVSQQFQRVYWNLFCFKYSIYCAHIALYSKLTLSILLVLLSLVFLSSNTIYVYTGINKYINGIHIERECVLRGIYKIRLKKISFYFKNIISIIRYVHCFFFLHLPNNETRYMLWLGYFDINVTKHTKTTGNRIFVLQFFFAYFIICFYNTFLI